MVYTEIIVSINVKDLETAEAIADVVSPDGIYVEDYSNLEADVLEIAHIDIIDESLLNKDRSVALIHIYLDKHRNPNEVISFLEQNFSSNNIEYSINSSNRSEEEWANNWRKYYNPIKIGEKLLICPKWLLDEVNNSDNRTVIKMEPGMAFGTGTHETTQLCLEFADSFVQSGQTVLDVGCGSGILSIASLLLGAQNAVAVDIDELATKVAFSNAVDNGVDEKYTVYVGDLTKKVQGSFNIVFANIVADQIIKLNQNISSFVLPGGIYIMSGIIDSRETEVVNSLPPCFEIVEIKRKNGWSAICVKNVG